MNLYLLVQLICICIVLFVIARFGNFLELSDILLVVIAFSLFDIRMAIRDKESK